MIKSLGTGDPYVQSYFVELWILSGFAQLGLGLNKQHKSEYKRQAVYKFHENEAFFVHINHHQFHSPKFMHLKIWTGMQQKYNLQPNKSFIPSFTKRHLLSNLLHIQTYYPIKFSVPSFTKRHRLEQFITHTTYYPIKFSVPSFTRRHLSSNLYISKFGLVCKKNTTYYPIKFHT
jgi:hypothetical protein